MSEEQLAEMGVEPVPSSCRLKSVEFGPSAKVGFTEWWQGASEKIKDEDLLWQHAVKATPQALTALVCFYMGLPTIRPQRCSLGGIGKSIFGYVAPGSATDSNFQRVINYKFPSSRIL